MKYDVSRETLKKADRCPHHGICQTAGGKPHCEISESINSTVYFLTCTHPNGCSYQHSFGSSFMCSCPVRQEIYNKYHI